MKVEVDTRSLWLELLTAGQDGEKDMDFFSVHAL